MPVREGLPPMPARLKKLRVDYRGYPIPWFVAYIDGKPDFRVMDGAKLSQAVKFKRCWVCGDPLGRRFTFAIGPMCAITRTIGEPPSHHDCVEWSARACPFLTLPKARRRPVDLTPEMSSSPTGIPRNPGVVLLWTTDAYRVITGQGGEPLFRIGAPSKLEYFAEGRQATREEIVESIESGLPYLRDMAAKEGPEALTELGRQIVRGYDLIPAA